MTIKKRQSDPAVRKARHREQNDRIKNRLDRIRSKILVMSGKGGVGKSSIAAYLAVALAKRNYRVGLMDIDLHGPSIPHLLGLTGKTGAISRGTQIAPVRYLPNLLVVSIETLLQGQDAATIWRGPLKSGVIRRFIADIEWKDLDFLVIDSPPGTGDEPLTIAQKIPDAKALIVTTPQELALADVRKSINFCRLANLEILGIVENMSGLQCPHCGHVIDVFKQDGGRYMAGDHQLELLATLPLDPEIVRLGDLGDMRLLDRPDHPFTRAFDTMVTVISKRLDPLRPSAVGPSAPNAGLH